MAMRIGPLFSAKFREKKSKKNRKKSSLNPDDLNSFRPISNLSFLSKIIERVVVKQFMNHADLNGLLPVRQSAYRRFHSTDVSSASRLYNDIIRSIDDGYVVALVLLDLSSAFDSVDHSTGPPCFPPSRPGFLSQSSHWTGFAHT